MTVTDRLEALPITAGAVALGFFDGVHRGHQAVIERAVTSGVTPCVFSFTAPANAARLYRIMTDDRRMEAIGALGVQYLVMPPFGDFSSMSPERFVEEVLVGVFHAKVAVCGKNFHFGYHAAGDSDQLRALCAASGIEVRIVDPVLYAGAPVSSTRIREALGEGRMEDVRAMLGRPYTIRIQVAHGRALGRRLAFPTINQPLPPILRLPKFGVYASLAEVDGVQYPAVSNVGVKPTVGSSGPLCETYIIGYEDDLYGREVPVSLLSFLRPEQKFASVDALGAQIAKDTEAALRYCTQEGCTSVR